MYTLERTNTLGFITYTIYFGNDAIATYDSYFEAVAILTMLKGL